VLIYPNAPGRNEAFHLLLPGTQCYTAVQDTVTMGIDESLAELTNYGTPAQTLWDNGVSGEAVVLLTSQGVWAISGLWDAASLATGRGNYEWAREAE
jgi:hypothetical protein